MRLVAAPVDEETANLRRMKAKGETRGHSPSKAVLVLMNWTIFTAAILADFARILAIYGLRWRIEVIYKRKRQNYSELWETLAQLDAHALPGSKSEIFWPEAELGSIYASIL